MIGPRSSISAVAELAPRVAALVGDEVDLQSLETKNLAKGRFDALKVLGDGELTKKLTVSAHRFSQSARGKIEKAGGEVIVLPAKKPVVKNKQGKKR